MTLGLPVYSEHGWQVFGRLLRLVITLALLLASGGTALLAWSQPFVGWTVAHWLDLGYAIGLTLISAGLAAGLVVLWRNRPLGPGLVRWVPRFWAVASFCWLSTVVWAAITPHISPAATVADTLKVAGIALVVTMAWRVSVKDVRLVTG